MVGMLVAKSNFNFVKLATKRFSNSLSDGDSLTISNCFPGPV
jgi:hypothetical protein